MLDLVKIAYKSALEEDVGTIPTLQPVPGSERRTGCCNKEDWALKSTKKACRLSEKQKAYLDAKFNIGQTSGGKLDGEVDAREMRRAQGPCARIFTLPSPEPTADLFLLLPPCCQGSETTTGSMIAMFRPAKRKSTSRWQGIWP